MERLRLKRAGGTLEGEVASGEDLRLLTEIVTDPRGWLSKHPESLRVHADVRPQQSSAVRERDRLHKLARVQEGRAKRYVVWADTASGPRIIKVAENLTAGAHLRGLFASVARREHHQQRRAEGLQLAAAASLGFVEVRRGLRLVRAVQLQNVMPPLESIEAHLARVPPEDGVRRFGEALARTHRLAFFHADLKGFHVFVDEARESDWWLRFIDFGRVSFHLTRRRRVINLYQALRFIVPPDAHLQEVFIATYCRCTGWSAHDVPGALRQVRRFLRHKERTHPVVESERA